MPSIALFIKELLAEDKYSSDFSDRIAERIDSMSAPQLQGLYTHLTSTATLAKSEVWMAANKELMSRIEGTLKVKMEEAKKLQKLLDDIDLKEMQRKRNAIAAKHEQRRVMQMIASTARLTAETEVHEAELKRQGDEKVEIMAKTYKGEERRNKWWRRIAVFLVIAIIGIAFGVPDILIMAAAIVFVVLLSIALVWYASTFTTVVPKEVTESDLEEQVHMKEDVYKKKAVAGLREKERKFREQERRDEEERRQRKRMRKKQRKFEVQLMESRRQDQIALAKEAISRRASMKDDPKTIIDTAAATATRAGTAATVQVGDSFMIAEGDEENRDSDSDSKQRNNNHDHSSSSSSSGTDTGNEDGDADQNDVFDQPGIETNGNKPSIGAATGDVELFSHEAIDSSDGNHSDSEKLSGDSDSADEIAMHRPVRHSSNRSISDHTGNSSSSGRGAAHNSSSSSSKQMFTSPVLSPSRVDVDPVDDTIAPGKDDGADYQIVATNLQLRDISENRNTSVHVENPVLNLQSSTSSSIQQLPQEEPPAAVLPATVEEGSLRADLLDNSGIVRIEPSMDSGRRNISSRERLAFLRATDSHKSIIESAMLVMDLSDEDLSLSSSSAPSVPPQQGKDQKSAQDDNATQHSLNSKHPSQRDLLGVDRETLDALGLDHTAMNKELAETDDFSTTDKQTSQ